MKTVDQLQTIAQTYEEICQGQEPWVAPGNFMNDWFDYAKDRREQLVTEAISLPETPDIENNRWATFCAASVEWLCQRYFVPCPAWVYNPTYNLSIPWFDSPAADMPEIRQWLIEQTPEPFTRRNIYLRDRARVSLAFSYGSELPCSFETLFLTLSNGFGRIYV